MWTVVREHLIAKLALVLFATLVIGFGVPALLNAQVQLSEMKRSGQAAAESVAHGLSAGVRTAMLSGNGLTARTMVHDARSRLGNVDVHIYAPSGEEVFSEPPPPPPRDSLPEHVRSVLDQSKAQEVGAETTALPIANEERCQSCHPDGTLRGVLTLGTADAKLSLRGGDETLDVLGAVATSAFTQIMTAEKEDDLDAYFAELAKEVSALRGVAILDLDGDPSFGADDLEIDADVVRLVLADGEPRTIGSPNGRIRLQALANAPQCHACHDEDDRWRGVIATAVDLRLQDPRAMLLSVADISVQHVMLSGLGRMIARFLDEVAATGAVTTLTLHDDKGRLFRDALSQAEPPETVRLVLANGTSQSELRSDGKGEHFIFAAPLTNDKECRQCHGSDHELRGAIAVRLDTSAAAASRERVVLTGVAFGIATIIATLLLLYLSLRALVVRPVAAMGDVADRVRGGHLGATVKVASVDEIGRLGERLNHMIGEIRQKLELSKFVSKATVGSIESSSAEAYQVGERARMTVLFSDIRGFTAFSEKVEPEEVVAMLNTYLGAQADVVDAHGGDIDKFVGDELMANFRGENMEAQAVRCSLAMVAAVRAVNEALPPESTRLEVGIGLNVGEVIFGAMGARNRMDFTVIGDAVNLGARLCSAASPGQVIISAAVREASGDLEGVEYIPLEPLSVKGKREPIIVFEVRRMTSPQA